MKNLRLFYLLSIVATLGFSSCEKDDDVEECVGTWSNTVIETNNGEQSYTITTYIVKEDGTYLYSCDDDNADTYTTEIGIWEYSAPSLWLVGSGGESSATAYVSGSSMTINSTVFIEN